VLEDSLLEFPGAMVLVTHDRYLLDRVSTKVIGLDQGRAGVFSDYSQWEAWRESVSEKTRVTEAPRPVRDTPKKKFSYLEQREWDGMEARILEAEEQLANRQTELQEAGSKGEGLKEAYEKLGEAQRRVDELYARWAELEANIPR